MITKKKKKKKKKKNKCDTESYIRNEKKNHYVL